MSLLSSIFQRSPGGLIAGYGLADWWTNELTADERDAIRKQVAQPLSAFDGLDKGGARQWHEPRNTFAFLSSLAQWFSRKDLRPIGCKIAAKMSQYSPDGLKVWDKHMVVNDAADYMLKARKLMQGAEDWALYYAELSVEFEDKVAAEWKKDIGKRGGDTTLPEHRGYEIVCKILTERGEKERAATYARQALRRGWAGKWERYIQK